MPQITDVSECSHYSVCFVEYSDGGTYICEICGETLGRVVWKD